jgi:hypothetical protein
MIRRRMNQMLDRNRAGGPRRSPPCLLAAAILAASASPAVASEVPPGGGFSLPIACTQGRDCWIMNYPDMASSPAVADPLCGPRSYDGHKGTDIAIRDRAAMRAGVPVLAAADGRVRGMRDGMADRFIDEAGLAALHGRDCGNGVLIDHGGGWQTQYCHMRRGSVAVQPGETVRRGQRLGLVGLSGRTAFPHVHLSVRHEGVDLDPLTGRAVGSGCDAARTGHTLWNAPDPARYRAGALYAVGLASGRVSSVGIKDNAASPATLSPTAPALVIWAALLGVRAGDQIEIEIRGADGKAIHRHTVRIDRDQAWRLTYSGIRRKAAAWPSGRYRGTATLRRDGPAPLNQTRQIELDIR